MEQLASMVLSGDGQYLIGAKSNQMEIQAFLDNVPAYMVDRIVYIQHCSGHMKKFGFSVCFRIKFVEFI